MPGKTIEELVTEIASAKSNASSFQAAIDEKMTLIDRQSETIGNLKERASSIATESVLGVIKVDGETINIDDTGKISVDEEHKVTNFVVAPPVLTASSNAYIDITNTIQASAQALLSEQFITKFYLTIPELNITNQEFTASEGSASITFMVPSTFEAGTIFHISVYASDSLGNKSKRTSIQLAASNGYVVTPSIIAPSANANVIANDTGLTVTTSSFSTVGSSDTQAALKIKITSDSSGQNILVQKTVNSGVSTYAFTVGELDSIATGTAYVFASHVGNTLGESEWSNGVAVTVKRAYVSKPSITSPLDNDTVYAMTGITIEGSSFSVQDSTDTHVSSDWVIYSDSTFETAVATANESSDLVSHTFTGLELSDNTTYYVKVRYRGSKFGVSEWSDAVAVTNVNISTTLENNSWEIIQQVGEEGNGANYWDIGDRKSVVLNGTIGTLSLSNQTFDVYIIEFNYKGINGVYFQGFKDHSAGTDLALCDWNTTATYGSSKNDGTKIFNMNHWGSSSNPYNTNYGGWKGCDIRYDILGSTSTTPSGYGATPTTSRVGYDATTATKTSPVTNTLMAALPEALRSALSPWTVYTDNVGNSSNVEANVTTSVDYLPLLSEFEVHGTRTYANQYEKNSQAQMTYYKNGGSKIKYNHSSSATAVYWWLRSAHYYSDHSFCCVHTGTAIYDTGIYSFGLSPAFRVAKTLITPSGRKIWRHENDKGSVIEFDMFGKTVQMFVADAQYRKRADTQFGTYGTDSSLNNFSTYYSGTNYFYSDGDTSSGATYQAGATSGTNVSVYSSLPALTDAQLQSRLSPLSTDLTARANCDVWMGYQGTTDSFSTPITGVPAVEWCRSLTSFDGISNGCDLPNLYELSVLYIEGDYIDALDPTLTSYPTMALGKGSNSIRWFRGNHAYSSTECSSNYACGVYYKGYVTDGTKYGANSVVPVRELSVTTNS